MFSYNVSDAQTHKFQAKRNIRHLRGWNRRTLRLFSNYVVVSVVVVVVAFAYSVRVDVTVEWIKRTPVTPLAMILVFYSCSAVLTHRQGRLQPRPSKAP